MQLLARAKINLTLRVTGRRGADEAHAGYHTLDSLVAFAAVGDRLRFAPAAALTLELSGPFAPALGGGGDNLVLTAARRLAAVGFAAGGRAPGAVIHLQKNLPVASGIGGGSADAAAALSGLAALWGLELDLAPLAAGIGADVPACLLGRACRLTGIGERLELLPALPPAWLVLANPLIPVPTPAVFARRQGAFSPPLAPPAAGFADAAALAAFARAGGNDLLSPALAVCPAIGPLLAALGGLPEALYAGLSGSGATGYALFATAAAAEAAATRLARAEPGWWVTAAALAG